MLWYILNHVEQMDGRKNKNNTKGHNKSRIQSKTQGQGHMPNEVSLLLPGICSHIYGIVIVSHYCYMTSIYIYYWTAFRVFIEFYF